MEEKFINLLFSAMNLQLTMLYALNMSLRACLVWWKWEERC